VSALEQQAHEIVAEVARQVAAADALATALRNIAGGHWNIGRAPGEDISPREYAREALRIAGLPKSW
jgi:ApbE superfamily uncharacterized protein (UPF0280 family)